MGVFDGHGGKVGLNDCTQNLENHWNSHCCRNCFIAAILREQQTTLLSAPQLTSGRTHTPHTSTHAHNSRARWVVTTLLLRIITHQHMPPPMPLP